MIKNMNEEAAGAIRLAAISITAPPTRTAYIAGESFDPAGMVVTATYTNGATRAVGGYTVEPSVLTVGASSVTIRYSEGGATRTAQQAVAVTKRSLAVPTWTGTLTYDGTEQAPAFTGYDSAYMTASGDLSATDAGDYAAVFALNNTEYTEWADGTTEDKTVPWSIGKATPTLVLSAESVTLDADHPTATVTVTTDSDGAISAESSDTSVATASVEGGTVTISNVDETRGEATVTVRVAETANWLAGSASVAVEAEYIGEVLPLSAARHSIAAATVGDYALFGGAYMNSTVDAYNKALTRSNPTKFPHNSGSRAATTVGNYALFGGGAGEGASKNAVVAYDASLTRSTPTALSVARSHLAATTVGNYALFGGGESSSGKVNTVNAYGAALTRTTPTVLSASRSLFAATTIAGYAVFGGGQSSNGNLPTIDVYDREANLVASAA